ncbi:uncharacterized protein LOC106673349 [Cimex lectularius]|uniref:NADH-ubiquinone oxidoreductase 9 kDa subunit n=1 Tax=Cimex lectularius TaxID=79782 RepID=A0A8I6SP73_CIMLE|nr:uncharacterized protein LOC106673349 [Cimex lectularius]
MLAVSRLRLLTPSLTNCTRSLTNQVEKTSSVPGLSENVLKVPSQEVGPGATKDGEYKNPEYFCYNKTSYFEAEIEMLKFRLPQPISKK